MSLFQTIVLTFEQKVTECGLDNKNNFILINILNVLIEFSFEAIVFLLLF